MDRLIANFAFLLGTMLLASSTTPLPADEPQAFVSPEKAQSHPAFTLQGEYVGEGFGVQVVALGEGQFRVVRYQGGLPGAGWDEKTRDVSEGDAELVEQAVSDAERVQRRSPTLGKRAPEGAVVLFDGSRQSLERHWKPGARIGDEGLLTEGCTSRETFTDFTAHVEFRLPFMPQARGQKRGNSGAYWQGRYETQMLDSFGLEGQDNECGGLYRVSAPRLNMCLPPLSWQTYDVEFATARYDEQGNKLRNARITVYLNGVLVQDDVELPGSTRAAPLKEADSPGPLYLQDHGNAVRFRNIWVKPTESSDRAAEKADGISHPS